MVEGKGLFAMFGVPSLAPEKKIKKAEDIKTKEEIAREAARAIQQAKTAPEGGGGAWKTSVGKRRGLALKARALGKPITVSENKNEIPETDPEDIAMGGTSDKKNKKKNRFSPYGGRAKAKPAIKAQDGTEQRIDILVSGFEAGTEAGVVPYLVLKSKKQWQPMDVKLDQGQMLITVNDPVIARILVRLDGYIFGTQQLSIRLFDPNSPLAVVIAPTTLTDTSNSKKSTTIDILRNFLKSRWNSELKFLNLDDMASDPILKKSAIHPPGTSRSNAIVGPAMMKLAGEMFPNMITISFAHNRLKNVQQISTLAQYLPNIQNISFQGNLMKDYANLEAISGTGKLKCLRELLMAGNPICESELKMRGNNRAYIRNLVKRFPSLVLLDGVPVQLTEDEMAIVYKTGHVLPLDNKGNFFDNEISQAATIDFINKYYQLFDHSRDALASMYDVNAVFSITSNVKLRTYQKLRRKDKKKLMEDEETLNWSSLSRNLMSKAKNQEGKGLLVGPEAIGSTLCRLPSTIHDLQKTEDFVVDAHQTPVGLLISLHGEFKEEENKPPYSYDRTFLLRPATADSPAMAAGWPYIIMNDTFCIRDYNGNNGFKPQASAPTSIFASYPGAM